MITIEKSYESMVAFVEAECVSGFGHGIDHGSVYKHEWYLFTGQDDGRPTFDSVDGLDPDRCGFEADHPVHIIHSYRRGYALVQQIDGKVNLEILAHAECLDHDGRFDSSSARDIERRRTEFLAAFHANSVVLP